MWTSCQILLGEKMNSFSFDLKKEVAKIECFGDEAISELSAIIKTSGEISKNSQGEKIVIFTEIEEVATKIEKYIKNIYGKDVSRQLTTNPFLHTNRIEISLPMDITRQVLLDTEIAKLDEEKYLEFQFGISPYLIQEEESAKAFLRGCFEGTFSCNINLSGTEKVSSTTGYHAEFVFSNEVFAQDFCFLLADFDIISKMTPRKNSFVVYVKGLDMVSDLLALVGANKGVLALQNESAYRSIRNNINRQNNCLTGNLTKTIDASVREIEAINILQNNFGLENLDLPLQEVAYLRLANPEESLDELVKLSTTKISKSGLYHRLKKLEKIAKELK